jgi:ATP synthase protein I
MSNQISNIEFRFTEEVLAQLRQPAADKPEPTAVLDDFFEGEGEAAVSSGSEQEVVADAESVGSSQSPTDRSMGEFYALRRELLVTTAAFGGIVFPAVWYFYDRNVALNYLLGAVTGIAYLKLLGRNVERLGTEKQKVGQSHIAVLVGVLILSSRLDGLHIFPVFMGFLTYKATLLLYALRAYLQPATAD